MNSFKGDGYSTCHLTMSGALTIFQHLEGNPLYCMHPPSMRIQLQQTIGFSLREDRLKLTPFTFRNNTISMTMEVVNLVPDSSVIR